MRYQVDFGRIWSWCMKCTPSVEVTSPLAGDPTKEGAKT